MPDWAVSRRRGFLTAANARPPELAVRSLEHYAQGVNITDVKSWAPAFSIQIRGVAFKVALSTVHLRTSCELRSLIRNKGVSRLAHERIWRDVGNVERISTFPPLLEPNIGAPR
jgi:hypothetical protein